MSAYVNLTEGTVHDLGDGHKMVRFENFLPDADFNTLATYNFDTESVTSAAYSHDYKVPLFRYYHNSSLRDSSYAHMLELKQARIDEELDEFKTRDGSKYRGEPSAYNPDCFLSAPDDIALIIQNVYADNFLKSYLEDNLGNGDITSSNAHLKVYQKVTSMPAGVDYVPMGIQTLKSSALSSPEVKYHGMIMLRDPAQPSSEGGGAYNFYHLEHDTNNPKYPVTQDPDISGNDGEEDQNGVFKVQVAYESNVGIFYTNTEGLFKMQHGWETSDYQYRQMRLKYMGSA